MKIRKPYVAGRFYPGTKKEIEEMLEQILEREKESIQYELAEKHIIGGVSPHAGYMFSAYQAVHLFELIRRSDKKYDTFVIVNPNHSGFGSEIALDSNDYWETPFGSVKIDKAMGEVMNLSVSSEAHRFEHSGEVMIPMLQYFLDYEFEILPVSVSKQTPDMAEAIAGQVFDANMELQKELFFIASSDFSHYVRPEIGEKMDQYVIDAILKLDKDSVYKQVKDKRISVCGYAPIMALIDYSLKSAKNPQVSMLKKGHSGEIIPGNEVVDYVSFLFYE
jgi:MEMO1 family protein